MMPPVSAAFVPNSMRAKRATNERRAQLSHLAVVFVTTVFCLATSSSPIGAETGPDIGLFADALGTSCNVEQSGPGIGKLYVLCTLGGAAAVGIHAAEFGVVGFPSDWLVNIEPSPVAETMLWDPLQGGGTVVFPDCEAGDGGVVLVATIQYYAPGPATAPGVLTLTRNEHRVDPNFQCPLIKTCDELPAELRVCVPGLDAVINGPSCPVSVEATSWSGLKSLFDLESAPAANR